MKLKLDENLGSLTVELFAQAGYDEATVASESLFSTEDEDLIEICRRERRCLVTLDLDFGNPLLPIEPLRHLLAEIGSSHRRTDG